MDAFFAAFAFLEGLRRFTSGRILAKNLPNAENAKKARKDLKTQCPDCYHENPGPTAEATHYGLAKDGRQQ